jgi:hypothetical protein
MLHAINTNSTVFNIFFNHIGAIIKFERITIIASARRQSVSLLEFVFQLRCPSQQSKIIIYESTEKKNC